MPAAKKPAAKPEPEEPAPVKVKATTAIRHRDVRVAAGAVMLSTDWIVERFPAMFEPVDGDGG